MSIIFTIAVSVITGMLAGLYSYTKGYAEGYEDSAKDRKESNGRGEAAVNLPWPGKHEADQGMDEAGD